jgi:WD40 repeat protein
VWDFRDPICSVQIYQGHNRSVNSAIFVGDAQIATASDDQTVKLWDLRVMRSPVCTIHVNSGVNRICTMTINTQNGHETRDSTYLCLPLDNRDIKVYNLQGERVARLPRNSRGVGHRRLVTSVASYGNFLFSGSFDKLVNCWSLEPKSSSTGTASSSSSKVLVNKENNNESETSQKHSPSSTNKAATVTYSASMNSSLSAAAAATAQTNNPVYQQGSPLNHITNKSNSNPLSKLAERIKI